MNTGMAMQITETSSEGLSREYTVVIPSDEIENKLTARLTEIGQAVLVRDAQEGAANRDSSGPKMLLYELAC